MRVRRFRHPFQTLAAALAASLLGCGGETGPTQPAVQAFTAVSAGSAHTCGLTLAGAAYCWGDNLDGELGDGTTLGRLTPVVVAARTGVTFAAVSAGRTHTCGVTPAGAASCWGYNVSGAGLGHLALGCDLEGARPAHGTVEDRRAERARWERADASI